MAIGCPSTPKQDGVPDLVNDDCREEATVLTDALADDSGPRRSDRPVPGEDVVTTESAAIDCVDVIYPFREGRVVEQQRRYELGCAKSVLILASDLRRTC